MSIYVQHRQIIFTFHCKMLIHYQADPETFCNLVTTLINDFINTSLQNRNRKKKTTKQRLGGPKNGFEAIKLPKRNCYNTRNYKDKAIYSVPINS